MSPGGFHFVVTHLETSKEINDQRNSQKGNVSGEVQQMLIQRGQKASVDVFIWPVCLYLPTVLLSLALEI